MPLFEGTQQQYYGTQTFTQSGSNSNPTYTLSFPVDNTVMNTLGTMPTSSGEFTVTQNGLAVTGFTYNPTTYVVTLGQAAADGDIILISIINPEYGNYQFISLQTIINNFMISYVGSNKIIPKVRKADVAFHAQRAIQELSYDTFKSTKSQEVEIGPSLKMPLPHDYVNYVKVCYIDSDGIEKLLYPARKTSNPTALLQDGSLGYMFDSSGTLQQASDSETWTRYSSNSSDEDSSDTYSKNDDDFDNFNGRRYGLEPENSQFNGLFFIDEKRGYINFSGGISGKIVTLKYISDGLGSEDEMIVHKFAEEAMYKSIAYAIASTHTSVAPNYIPLLKRERFVAIRNAKLRLSNLKIEELTQIMRGKSKIIKH
jgi:hypothetical protein